MKGWKMLHKIKVLHEEGLSNRAIARQLGIDRQTVKKYIEMKEEEISRGLAERTRGKELDHYRDYLLHLLQKYPALSAVKVRRKLESKNVKIGVSNRTLRRYLRGLKEGVVLKQKRYYEPVLDMVPAQQCQVDAGELRGVRIGEESQSVYFLVFVLSYSRLMYVGLSFKPINTETFIGKHDEAFRYFGGRAEECVYDQTKLVAIKEEFREVWFNEAFYRYATYARFDIRVCEGFDPESKGKVEAGVKYVKNDFFYGEEFASQAQLAEALHQWLDHVANQRIHGTTAQRPQGVYDNHEKPQMKAYFAPEQLMPSPQGESRKVDKTGLISFQSNKYSVPMPYQSSKVWVKEEGDRLGIYDFHSQEEIASHPLSLGKGQVLKNTNHYRDYQQELADHEATIGRVLGEQLAQKLCALLKTTLPKIYKDQLVGLMKLLQLYSEKQDLNTPLEHLANREQLKVSFIKNYLQAFYAKRGIGSRASSPLLAGEALNKYVRLDDNSAKEVAYALD